MEGSESPEGGGTRCGSGGGGSSSGHLGVNKAHSAKINKVVKRSVIQPPKPQAPVYTIDKNDFRLIVQKLTGSTANDMQSSPTTPPPPPPPQTSSAPPPPQPQIAAPLQPPNQNQNPSRFHRARPPPLQSVQSFNKLVSNLTPITNIPPQSLPHHHQLQHHHPPTSANFTTTTTASRPINSFAFRPTPPAPTFRFATPFPPPPNFNLSAAFSRPQPPFMAAAPPLPSTAAPPLQNSQPQFISFSPLPSPSSQFQAFAGASSQVPLSPGSIFPISPSGHFQGALPPLSPGSFPLSPRQFPFPFTSF